MCDDVTDLCVEDARALYHHPAGPTLSPAYKEEEPRKRAPRALTGRYVRTGTAASPRVLQILRKKVEDRLKLKELLGENSHLYFGSGKQASQSPYKQQPQQRPKKKFWLENSYLGTKLWTKNISCNLTILLKQNYGVYKWNLLNILSFYSRAPSV